MLVSVYLVFVPGEAFDSLFTILVLRYVKHFVGINFKMWRIPQNIARESIRENITTEFIDTGSRTIRWYSIVSMRPTQFSRNNRIFGNDRNCPVGSLTTTTEYDRFFFSDAVKWSNLKIEIVEIALNRLDLWWIYLRHHSDDSPVWSILRK